MILRILTAVLLFLSVQNVSLAQVELQPLVATEVSFERAAADKGMKAAFLEFLRDDAIVFAPGPVNGRDYWKARQDDSNSQPSRNLTYSDISANGLLGYTTGNWRIFQKGKSEGLAKFGQYVTIWERSPGGAFKVSVEIEVSHEKLPFSETDKPIRANQKRDINKRRWSPADASMNFLRASMTSEKLGGAYEKFAADDVRILRDGAPPIIGKKNAIEAMNEYLSVEFPKKVSLFQSADLAYTWNPCQFDNSSEGMSKGNCLHIWKLRNKKWWIVLGVFAPILNETEPTLKMKAKR
jgi:ketosteroid isomerase-like protein